MQAIQYKLLFLSRLIGKINDKEYITSRLGGHLGATEEELELFKSLLNQLPEEKKKEVKAEYKCPYLTDKYTMEDGTIIILKSV